MTSDPAAIAAKMKPDEAELFGYADMLVGKIYIISTYANALIAKGLMELDEDGMMHRFTPLGRAVAAAIRERGE
jgi:hypothetical protein